MGYPLRKLAFLKFSEVHLNRILEHKNLVENQKRKSVRCFSVDHPLRLQQISRSDLFTQSLKNGSKGVAEKELPRPQKATALVPTFCGRDYGRDVVSLSPAVRQAKRRN